VIPYYIDTAVCLGSAMLGMKAADEEKLNLWGMSREMVLTEDVMSRLSKDGTVIYPTNDKVDNRIMRAKYAIFRDMAETQSRYRREVDDALKRNH
jgi:ribulose kinase